MPETQYFNHPSAIYTTTGAPAAGTDEVQSLVGSGTITAGTFRLSFGGFVTAAINWNAAAAAVETALNALPSMAAGGTAALGVAVTGGALPGTAMTITYSGSNVRKKSTPLIILHQNSLTGGGTMVIAETTPGVDASPGARGSLNIRLDTGALDQNTGVAGSPIWSTR